jgi:hypothetical protein
MSIYRRKVGIYESGQRKIDMAYRCSVTWAAMLMLSVPHLAQEVHHHAGWPAAHPFLDHVRVGYEAVALALIVGLLCRPCRQGEVACIEANVMQKLLA